MAKNTSYIGKYVNYTVPSGGDPDVKWRIFYVDGMNGETVDENDRHIYLISDDGISCDYIPDKTKDGTTYKISQSNAKYYFDISDMADLYTGSANITDTRITKWMKWAKQYPNSTSLSIRSISYMLDVEIWNRKYQNNYANYVIGGPTLELFCASYKATHPNRYIECESMDSNGYNIKWNDDSYSTYIGDLNTSESENLYVWEFYSDHNIWTYWLASQSTSELFEVYYVGNRTSSGEPNTRRDEWLYILWTSPSTWLTPNNLSKI